VDQVRRADRVLAAAIAVWMVVIVMLFLAAADARGYSDSLCRAYQPAETCVVSRSA
jgi:hypothetical protein